MIKKVLALLLTAMLIVSSMTLVAFAEEETPARVPITPCDTLTGWHGAGSEGIPEPELNDTLSDYPVVSFTYSGTLYANGGWRHPEGNGKSPTNGIKILYLPTETDAKSHDISDMNVLVFDLYISDASLLNNAGFQMELGSAGRSDKLEQNLETSLKGMKGAPLENGWNHFEIPLRAFNDASGDDHLPMDRTAWNFLRLYNMSEINLGDKELVLAFRDMYFAAEETIDNTDASANADEMTATEHRVPVFGCNSALVDLIPDTEEKTAGMSSISYTFMAGEQKNSTNRSSLSQTVDGTGMDTLEFDLYLSDLAIVDMFVSDAHIGDNAIELSSTGRSDIGEYDWKLSNIFKSRNDWKVGWNHVELPLSTARETQGPSNNPDAATPFDLSAVNFLGIYWVMKAPAPKECTIKFDNIALTDAQVNKEAQVEEESAPIIAQAKALEGLKLADINADNYASLKEQTAALEKAYEELSYEARMAADAVLDINKIIRVASRALDNYESTLTPSEPEVPEEPHEPTEPETPDTPDEPDEPDTPVTPDEPTEPDTPVDPETPDEPTAPAKGGLNPIVIVAIVAAVLAVVAVVVVVIVKKKKA